MIALQQGLLIAPTLTSQVSNLRAAASFTEKRQIRFHLPWINYQFDLPTFLTRPLCRVFSHPNTYTPAQRTEFVEGITNYYVDKGMPAFYVNVFFVPLEADLCFIVVSPRTISSELQSSTLRNTTRIDTLP